MRVLYSQAAQRDRLRLVEYIEQFSYAAADRLDERIEQHVALLGSFPKMGRTVGGDTDRELPIRKAELLLRYRIEDDHILILRILHTAQDWPGRF